MHCAGGDGARPALRTVFCDGGVGRRRRHECRHRGGKAGVAAGHAAGETTATFAWVENNGRWDAEGTALTATAESGEIVLNGHKSYVVDGHTADLIVVLARAPQGLSLFTVDGNAPGLTRRALKSMDPTRKFARLELNRVPARSVRPAERRPRSPARWSRPRSVWPMKWSVGPTGCGRIRWPMR